MGLNLHVFYFFTIFPWLEIGDKVATVVPLLFSSLLLKLDWSNYFFYHNLQRIADSLNVEIKRWVAGKEGNMRALLASLQYVSSLISFQHYTSWILKGKKISNTFNFWNSCWFSSLLLDCSPPRKKFEVGVYEKLHKGSFCNLLLFSNPRECSCWLTLCFFFPFCHLLIFSDPRE